MTLPLVLLLTSALPAGAELRLPGSLANAPRLTIVTPPPWKAATRAGPDGRLRISFQLPLVQKTEAMSADSDGRLKVTSELGRLTFRPFELEGLAHQLEITLALEGGSGARVEARCQPRRGSAEGSLWSAWSPVSAKAGYFVPGGAAASAFQLRMTFPETDGLRLVAMEIIARDVPTRHAPEEEEEERPRAARAGRSRGPVSTRTVSRKGWGARGMKNPGDPEWDQPKIRGIVVHHSVIPSVVDFEERGGVALMRSIQRSHMEDRGWRDIAYHYLITPDGVLYEGVPEKVEGSHMRADCNGIIAVCLIGNCDILSEFEKAKPGRRRLWMVVERLCRKYGISPAKVTGHQDFQPDRDCPGVHLYRELRMFRRKPAAVR